jgi:dynein heavy chain
MHRTTFLQFFEVIETKLLLMTYDSKDELIPMLEFPSVIRKKSVSFIKRNPAQLVAETLDYDVDVVDVFPSPLQQLSTLVSDVFLPILENPKNQESWPEVVAQDVKRHFHRLVANVAVVLSQTKVCFVLSRQALVFPCILLFYKVL